MTRSIDRLINLRDPLGRESYARNITIMKLSVNLKFYSVSHILKASKYFQMATCPIGGKYDTNFGIIATVFSEDFIFWQKCLKLNMTNKYFYKALLEKTKMFNFIDCIVFLMVLNN